MDQTLILGLIALSIGLSVWAIARDERPVWRFAAPVLPSLKTGSRFEIVFDYSVASGQAHAPAIVDFSDGLTLLWFEGSAEAQADVEIMAARLDWQKAKWRASPSGAFLTTAGLGQALVPQQKVVTLGNTIDGGGHDRIFATIVSVGGWAMASVAAITMDADKPAKAEKLNLSPFLNRSHLVKSPVIAFDDGRSGLPVYFEMGATYGVLAYLDRSGRVRDTARLAGPGKPIQPMIVSLDSSKGIAFLRDFDRSGDLLVSHTTDGGCNWSPSRPAGLPNPSAPVAAVALAMDKVLVVANDDPQGGDRMSLLEYGPVTRSWRRLRELEPNGAGARYPMMRVLPDGDIMLTYSTGNKTGLRVVVFSCSWAITEH
ncbi:MAG: exo-alpha-sialidase [Pseudomonadota bacterium]